MRHQQTVIKSLKRSCQSSFLKLNRRHIYSNSGVPVVAVPCCYTKAEFQHASKHNAGDKYIRSLASSSGVIPFLIPCLEEVYQKFNPKWMHDILDRVDGVMLTGTQSNLHPSRYHTTENPEIHKNFDVERDAIVFELLDAVFAKKMPLFGICRGHQEINVYLGGTVCPNINDEPHYKGVFHGFPTDNDIDDGSMAFQDKKYGNAHEVFLKKGGMLQKIMGGGVESISVNSCHYQGLAEIGNGLEIEATAPDGLVEAVSLKSEDHWALSVQWHPEYQPKLNPKQRSLFGAFGEEIRRVQAVNSKLKAN